MQSHPPLWLLNELFLNETVQGGLHALQSSLVLPDAWSDHSPNDLENILLCRISNEAGSSMVPLQITHCLKIEKDMSWSLFVKQHVTLSPNRCS